MPEFSLPQISLQEITSWFTYDPTNPLLFSTTLFWCIFAVFYCIYAFTKDYRKFRTFYVIIFSLFYYYKAGGIFFILLIGSISFNFIFTEAMDLSLKQWKRKACLTFIIVANLMVLGYFKYTSFFLENINTIFSQDFTLHKILLPIGISFYTFQAISYAIDLYKKEIKPANNIWDFAFYLSFFPQLVAGPIVRAKTFLPQMKEKLILSDRDMGLALFMIIMGLIKKTVISDYISLNFVSRIFDSPSSYTAFENLMATYGYTIQIFCDFSGYSDIAIGLGLLMGFHLPKNFHTPYKSTSVTEFWKRWHISLSTWLRDYLYIPLGGNRKGKARTYINLFLTMLIGGLWHGASWRFIAWGGLHGIMLAIERFFKETIRKPKNYIPGLLIAIVVIAISWIIFEKDNILLAFSVTQLDQTYEIKEITFIIFSILKYLIIAIAIGYILYIIPNNLIIRTVCILLTFHFISFCWIFFRADSFEIAWNLIGNIGNITFDTDEWFTIIMAYKNVFIVILVGYILHFLPEKLVTTIQNAFIWLPFPIKGIIFGFIFWLIYATASSEPQPFIYFQF